MGQINENQKDDVPVSNAIRYSVMRSILVWIIMTAATLDYLGDPGRRNGKIVGQKVNLLGSHSASFSSKDLR